MLSTPSIEKPSAAFNLAHFIFALSISYSILGTWQLDIIIKSTLILVLSSIVTTLLILFQPFENLFWVLNYRKSIPRWVFWTPYLSQHRMRFAGGCYTITAISVFFLVNPIQIPYPWHTLGLLSILLILPVIVWNAYKARTPAHLATRIYRLENYSVDRGPKFRSQTPQGELVGEVIIRVFSLLSEARKALIQGTPEEAKNFIRLADILSKQLPP